MDKITLPEFALTIEDLESTGIDATAFVNDPATGQHFLAFSKQTDKRLALSTDEQRLVTGPLLVPEQRIYRKDPDGQEYNVFFTKDQILKLAKGIGVKGVFNKLNAEHDPDQPLSDVTLCELWLTGVNDKAKSLGYDLPEGSLMASYHVRNDAVWKAVKNGQFNGFSIEGLFSRVKLSKEKSLPSDGRNAVGALSESDTDMNILDEIKKLLAIDKKVELSADQAKPEVTEEVKTEATAEVKNEGPTKEDIENINAAIKTLAESVAAVVAEGKSLRETTEKAVAQFSAEINAQKEQIVKLSAQPDGNPAGQEKKKAAVKSINPVADALLAKLNKSN